MSGCLSSISFSAPPQWNDALNFQGEHCQTHAELTPTCQREGVEVGYQSLKLLQEAHPSWALWTSPLPRTLPLFRTRAFLDWYVVHQHMGISAVPDWSRGYRNSASPPRSDCTSSSRNISYFVFKRNNSIIVWTALEHDYQKIVPAPAKHRRGFRSLEPTHHALVVITTCARSGRRAESDGSSHMFALSLCIILLI